MCELDRRGGEKMKNTFDELIKHPNPFEMSIAEASEKRFEGIKEMFSYHYDNNTLYRKYCNKHEIAPADIKNHEDLVYIPLLPSDMFKALSTSGTEDDIEKIASVPRSSIVTYFTTSGTTGIPTRYPFDRESIRRTTVSNILINRYIGEIREDSYLLMLTPSLEETKTGLVQGMYMAVRPILKRDDQISFGIKNGKLDLENIVSALSLTNYRPRHLFGPPFVYKEMAEYLIRKGSKLKLEEESKAFMREGGKESKEKLEEKN